MENSKSAMDLEALQHTIDKLSPEKRAKFEDLHKEILERPWIPNPGPQTDAYKSKADILLYGGAAGGGKTDLLCGIAWEHQRGFIVRRKSTELDGIISRAKVIFKDRGDYNKVEKDWSFENGGALKLGGMKDADDWGDYAGRARDYMGFDEAAEFLENQVASLIAWLRHEDVNQRCRMILASNPPRGADGQWITRWFAPWLDPLFNNPAAPGELRWAIYVKDEIIWCDEHEVRIIDGEEYETLSYTFIPALLDDNPYYKDNRKYRAGLQRLPEPLRTQLIKGDFTAGKEDDEWQVIPSEWVDLAFERWESTEKPSTMIALSADIGQGGSGDPTTLAALHTGSWFAPIREFREDVKDGYKVAELIIKERRNGADLSLDLTAGWGAAPKEALERDFSVHVTGLVASEKSGRYSRDRRFGFVNQRAEWWWLFREALDPNNDPADLPKLPPDPKLKAQLCAPTWKLKGTNIQIEEKQEIKKRLGASTDRADAVIQAWSRREQAVLMSGVKNKEWTEAEPDDDPFEGI